MNPLDEYLEMKKEAGFGDLLRGAWQGFSGGVDPSRAVGDAKDLLKATGSALKKIKGGGSPQALELLQHHNAALSAATAGPGHDALTRGFSLGQKAQVPALAIGGTLALAGTVMAIRKIHGAMTKQRDFKQMMALHPQLADVQAQRPQMFNQAYSSLRRMNPALTADPIVAGSFMNKLMINPEAAGMTLAEVANMATPQRQGLRVSKFGPLELK